MVGIASRPKAGRPRLCVCCGEPTATRIIPACWDHWNALPEDLRSAIVINSGRGQLDRYGDCLVEAIQAWRQTGLWRSKYVKTTSAPLGDRPPPCLLDLTRTARSFLSDAAG